MSLWTTHLQRIYKYLMISTDIYRWGFSTCEVCKFAGDDRRSCTATRCWKQMDHKGGNEFGEATTFDVWSLTMQHFFKSKIGIFLVSMDLCYQDIFMFSCPKDLDCWAHVCQTFDSRMEQIRGEYFKELRIMQAQRNSSSCFEVLGWLPRPPVQGIVAQDETWFDQTAVLLSLSHGTRRN